jgi:ABC-type arginine transport system permease subunit
MANATKGRSKKKKAHTPQVRKATQLSAAEQRKAARKVAKKVSEPSLFKTAWFWIPLLVALVTSPALAFLSAGVGVLFVIVGACLQKTDRMRGRLLVAGLGAVIGSLPYIVYLVLGWVGVIG